MTELFNPFTGETVEVSKAVSPMFGAKHAFTDQPTRKARALVPTGNHVSHANALHVTHHRKRKDVGRFGDTALRRFSKSVGGRTAAALASETAGGAALVYSLHDKDKRIKRLERKSGVTKRDVSDLASQPGMINPGVVTSSWSHGTANQNFAASQGRRGRKIA